jgi:DNA-binding NarL/FixJ family response regulator
MKTVRVLLADDHAVVRAGIRNALTELPGLIILGEVGDGPTLLAAIARLPVDLLLMDVTMPNFEPIPAIRHIRATQPNLKILVISAYDDDLYVQGLLGAGVDGYHLKDQSLEDLRLAVQRVLAGEKWVSSRLVSKLFSGQSYTVGTPLLTTRQRELLHLLREGLDNQTLARRMGLSVKTVENHLTRLYRQLNVQSRLEAVNLAIEQPHLTRASDTDAEVAHTPLEPPLGAAFAILLVDDNARYRSQLRRMVGKISPQAQIYDAENIQSALTLAQRTTPQLAFVDVVLGDEDGIRCTQRIKTLSPATHIVLISAYPDREFHRRGLDAGAIAFLDKKDLDTAALRQVINDVVR